MNERRDDLQEIIDKALDEMAAEAGDGFDPPGVQPGGVLPQDGPHEVEGQDDQEARLQGAPARQQRPEGRDYRAHRAHRPCGRPAREGRHQLAGDLREAGQ